MRNRLEGGSPAVIRRWLRRLGVFLTAVALDPGFAIAQRTGSLSPSALAFGGQTVTTFGADQSITITNTSTSGSITVTALSNSDSLTFIGIGGTCGPPPFILAVGANCTVRLAFFPGSTGPFNGTFAVAATTPAATFTPASVALSGTGTPVPATLAPATLDLGNQVVLTIGNGQDVVVGNSSSQANLTVTGIALTDSMRFFRSGGTCANPPFSVSPSGSCTLRFAFRPDAVGPFSSVLTISGTTPAATFVPASVNLVGTGVPVPGTFAPAALAFGNQTITSLSEPRFVTLGSVPGTGSFRVDALAISNPQRFIVQGGTCGSPPFTLGNGGSCTVGIVFFPEQDLGEITALLSVAISTPPSAFTPSSVALSGTGVPVPGTLAPASLAYTSQTVTTTSAPKDVTIANTDTFATLRVLALSLSDPAHFVVTGGTCGTPPFFVGPGISCTVGVAFRSDQAGIFNGTFSIAGTTPATNFAPASVSLAGRAISVTGTVGPASLAFGTHTVTTTSASQTVTITNTHPSVAFEVDTLSITNPTRFTRTGGTCGTPPFPVAAGASCTIEIAFGSATPGTFTGALSIDTTASTTFAPASITLGGTAVALPAVFAPSAIDFGFLGAGVTSGSQPVQIGNADTLASLTVTGIVISDPTRFLFVPGGTCPGVPFVVPAGGSCAILVAFRPVLPPGPVSTTLRVNTAPASAFVPATVSLSGLGGSDVLLLDGFE